MYLSVDNKVNSVIVFGLLVSSLAVPIIRATVSTGLNTAPALHLDVSVSKSAQRLRQAGKYRGMLAIFRFRSRKFGETLCQIVYPVQIPSHHSYTLCFHLVLY